MWLNQNGLQLATPNVGDRGSELLGWWMIPTDLLLGALVVIGTTMFLRWMLRFAARPSRRAIVPASAPRRGRE